MANRACRGHPRTVPYPKMSSTGRTELQMSLSGAKNVKEAAGDVRFGAAPPKSVENDEKPKKKSEKNIEKNFRCRKIEGCKSSETRFPKVWRLCGPCSWPRLRSEAKRAGKILFVSFLAEFLPCLPFSSLICHCCPFLYLC